MPSLNKAIIIGYLGQDPELKESKNKPMTLLSVCTSDKYHNKETGKDETYVQWHRVSVFGPQAEFIARNAFKGSLVAVEGKIVYLDYVTPANEKRKLTNITVSQYEGRCQILTPKKSILESPEETLYKQTGIRKGEAPSEPASTSYAPKAIISRPLVEEFDDDIPF